MRSSRAVPPVRQIATQLSKQELTLLGEAIERHAPELHYLLTDIDHESWLAAGPGAVEDATRDCSPSRFEIRSITRHKGNQ
jgi:hypothetical protein